MAAHPNQLAALRKHAFLPGQSGKPEGGRVVAAREREAAAKADAIMAALDRVADDVLEDVMRDLARALASGARQHRYVLVALLNRLWPATAIELLVASLQITRLGHASPATTLKIYSHALPSKIKSTADKVDELFGS